MVLLLVANIGCGVPHAEALTVRQPTPAQTPQQQTFKDGDGDGVPDGADACDHRGEDWRSPYPADGCPRFVDLRETLESHFQQRHQRWHFPTSTLFEGNTKKLKPRASALLAAIASKVKPGTGLTVFAFGGTEDDAWFQKLHTDRQVVAIMSELRSAGLAPQQLTGAGLGGYCGQPSAMGTVQVVLASNAAICASAEAAGVIRRPLSNEVLAGSKTP